MMLAWWVAIFRVALANRAGGGFNMIKGEILALGSEPLMAF
jgi:hypothetical protein